MNSEETSTKIRLVRPEPAHPRTHGGRLGGRGDDEELRVTYDVKVENSP